MNGGYLVENNLPPDPVNRMDSIDGSQNRKNFSVTHLLDLEEVSVMSCMKDPAGGMKRVGKVIQEQSGASSGSEAAPQDSESRSPRTRAQLPVYSLLIQFI